MHLWSASDTTGAMLSHSRLREGRERGTEKARMHVSAHYPRAGRRLDKGCHIAQRWLHQCTWSTPHAVRRPRNHERECL